MPELRVLCEGLTEQHFVALVLRPHLRHFRLAAKAQPLLPRGGGIVPYPLMRESVWRELKRARDPLHVTTMIDLYGLGEYPSAAPRAGESGAQRARRIEHAMAVDIQDSRFIPYIQVHEFEALVLADPDLLPDLFPDGEADGAPQALRESMAGAAPEDVNTGLETAPSKRIIRAVPAYRSMKSTAGPILAARIGLPRLRAACPHFGEWLLRLEGLAG